MSGNGMRCLAQARRGRRAGRPAVLTVATAGGRADGRVHAGRRCRVGHGPGRHGPGPAGAGPAPESPTARARTVDVGNPHLVLLGPDRPASTCAELGPKLPAGLRGGVNVEWITRGPRRRRPLLDLRVFERGVGETLACGTGSVAAAAAARSWGWSVRTPGGRAQPRRDPRGHAWAPTRTPPRPGGPGALGRRRGRPSGDALLSNLLPTTLIERTFRERIVLVGVVFPGRTRRGGRRGPRRAGPAGRHRRAPTSWRASSSAATRPTRRPSSGRGKARGAARALPSGRRRHGGLRRRADPGPAAQPREAPRPHRHRPHGGDPGHLRPERPQPRGQGPGRAGPAAVPPAAAARPGLAAQPAGRRHRHPGPRRDPARGRPPPPGAAHAPARGRAARGRAHPRAPARSRAAGAGTARWPSWATPTPASPRCSTRSPTPASRSRTASSSTLDPRTRQRRCPAGETVLVTDTVGFVRKLPHELVEAFRSTLDSVRQADLLVHVVDGSAPDPRRRSTRCARCWPRSAPTDVPELLVFNKADRAPDDAPRLAARDPGSVLVSATHRRGDRRVAARARPTGCAARTASSSCVVPLERGDVLAAVHREGEVVETARRRRGGDRCTSCSTRWAGPASQRSWRHGDADERSACRPTPTTAWPAWPRWPPRHEGGMVDCSIGTPCDPPPPAVVAALARRAPSAGYPPSAGSPACARRPARGCGAASASTCRLGELAACVGTKEFVASVPHLLRLRRPDATPCCTRRCRYPTYAMGAALAGCRAVAVPPAPGRVGGLDLGAVAPTTRRAPWCCGPTRPPTRPGAWTTSAPRPPGAVPTACRSSPTSATAEFTWDGPPRSILEHGIEGVLAVHSLSKRSNLAGVRVGFYAGDAELVGFLRAVRQHAGLMVPGPVQAAGRGGPRRRRARGGAAGALPRAARRTGRRARGLRLPGAPVPAGGFYLWVPVPPGRGPDAWAIAAAPWPRAAGCSSAPATSTAPAGAGHVRVAVVQPLERLAAGGGAAR